MFLIIKNSQLNTVHNIYSCFASFWNDFEIELIVSVYYLDWCCISAETEMSIKAILLVLAIIENTFVIDLLIWQQKSYKVILYETQYFKTEFVVRNIYVPDSSRCCLNLLDDRGFLLQVVLPALQYFNRPYRLNGYFSYKKYVKLRGRQPNEFMQTKKVLSTKNSHLYSVTIIL